MARARAIDTRLEKLVPAVEEYIITGIYTTEEVKDLIRHRTDDEYRLVARPLLLLDVRNAIQFEHDMEVKIAAYCSRSKVNLKHRWSVVERMEQLYKIGLKHLKHPAEREALRQEMVIFLKRYNRSSSLASHYAELVVKNPLNASFWTEAALYANEIGEIDNARISVQHAIRLLPNSEDVYACALSIELTFAHKIIRAAIAEHHERVERLQRTLAVGAAPPIVDPVERMRSENAALFQVVVNLALCRVIVDEVVSRAEACTPDLILRLYKLTLSFPFGRSLAAYILEHAVTDRLLPAIILRTRVDESSSGHIHKKSEEWFRRWTSGSGGGEVMSALVSLDTECCLASRAKGAVCDVESYLRDECHQGTSKRVIPKPLQLRHAVAQTIMNASATLYGFFPHKDCEDPDLLEFGFRRFVVPFLQEKMLTTWLPFRDDASTRRKQSKESETDASYVFQKDLQRAVAKSIVRTSTLAGGLLSDALMNVAEHVAAACGADAASMTTTAIHFLEHIVTGGVLPEDAPPLAIHGGIQWQPAIVLTILPSQSLPELGIVESLDTQGPRVATKKSLEEEIAWFLSMLQSGRKDDVLANLWRYLKEKLRFSMNASESTDNWTPSLALSRFPAAFRLEVLQEIPIGVWQMFLMAEEANPTNVGSSSSVAVPKDSDSDNSDDDNKETMPASKRRRIDSVSSTFKDSAMLKDSYGALGLKFLSCHVHAKLGESDQILRAEGIFQIALHTMSHIFGCDSSADFSREVVCSKLCSDSVDIANTRLMAAASLLDALSALSPLPRQVFTAIDIPLNEGVYLWRREQHYTKNLVADARQAAINAHERALAQYQMMSGKGGSRVHERSPVINAIYRDHFAAVEVACETDAAVQKHVHQYISTGELNAQDWKQFVTFARFVDGDLLLAQKLVARSKVEAVDARHTCAALASIK